MVFLPAEIIHQIVIYIQNTPPPMEEGKMSVFIFSSTSSIARYAAVSRQWQAVVERIIWQRITLRKQRSLAQLRDYTASNDPYCYARVGYIRHVQWSDTVIDWSELNERTAEASDVALYARLLPEWYNKAFLGALSEMLHLLTRWTNEKITNGMELSLWLNGGDFIPCENDNDVRIEPQECAMLDIDGLWQRSQMPYQAHLTPEDTAGLPIVPFITSVTLPDIYYLEARPSTFFRLLSRFPNLRQVSGGKGGLIPREALRALVDQRQEVVDHLLLVPDSIETFEYKVDGYREMSRNPAHDAANYLSPHDVDEFSVAFRTFSTRLRKLHLESVRVSSSLFWPGPRETDHDDATLHWPKLEEITIIEVPPYTADGRWILDNNPSKRCAYDLDADPDQDWDYNLNPYGQRDFIKGDEADKLYEAMGCAARRMPRLQKLKFTFRAEIPEEGPTERLGFERDLATGKSRVLITSNSYNYYPGESVIAAWGMQGKSVSQYKQCYAEFGQWP